MDVPLTKAVTACGGLSDNEQKGRRVRDCRREQSPPESNCVFLRDLNKLDSWMECGPRGS